jgi:hypothetical protein
MFDEQCDDLKVVIRERNLVVLRNILRGLVGAWGI